jgi:hypothetical protein
MPVVVEEEVEQQPLAHPVVPVVEGRQDVMAMSVLVVQMD